MARKKVVVKESDTGSDSEEIEPVKKTKKENNKSKTAIKDFSDSEDVSVDEEGDMVYNAYTNPVEGAKNEPNFSLALKLALLAELRTANKRKTSSYKVALRYLDWSSIKIDGYTTDELKACLDEILKPLCSIRTLDEMLNDYETHHQKYDLKMHPDAPKIPRNAVMRYIDDNREKFKKALCKEFPDKQIGLKEISSYGAKKFSQLPEKEQERYKIQYKTELKEYGEKKAELLKQCPDLIKKRVRKPKEPKEKAIKKERKKKELPYITPFMVFREELEKKGRNVSYHDAQQLYKNLPDEEKRKHIQSLMILDTPLEKQFSSNERKIMKNSNGMPQKPLSSYNLFIKELCKEKTVDKKDMLKASSNIWKTMDAEQKNHYEELHKKEVEIWQREMEEWIKTLPIEQRVEQMAKHGFLKKMESTKKRRQTIDGGFLSPAEPNHAKKLKKAIVPELDLVKLKKEKPEEKSVINVTASESKTKQSISDESPKKKNKRLESDTSSIEGTPRKKKFKEIIESFGPYPSLKTAHYFMTQKYSGKPQKVAKAYNKLSPSEKKDLYQEVKKAKAQYFVKLKKFAEQNEQYANKLRQFHDNNRKEQEESISWHKGNKTDISDDSDDSDHSEDSNSS